MKQIDPEEHNQNVSNVNHFKEILILVFSIFGFVIFLYWASIFVVDKLVDGLTPEIESRLFNIMEKYPTKNDDTASNNNPKFIKAKKLLNSLVEHSSLKGQSYRLKIIPGKDINAFALPGNTILIVNELFERIESENELAMVLGHELGHFHHKHHLKNMGRQFVMGFFSMVIFGDDNPVSKFFLGGLDYTEKSFNREQESDCDIYGADLVVKKYSHLAGAFGFFERLKKDESILHKYFSTHPISEDRINKVKSFALANGFSTTGELTPLELRPDSL